MGDIDLLINPANRQAAKKALMSSGFACTAQNGPVYDYRKGDVLLEVHTALISDDPRWRLPLQTPWIKPNLKAAAANWRTITTLPI